MGDEISRHEFSEEDFLLFRERLEQETRQLKQVFQQQAFDNAPETGGFELEICLTDPSGRPRPDNARFLEQVSDLDVVPELSRFNVELNTPPRQLSADALSLMHGSLQQTWSECTRAAGMLGDRLLMIGTLPSLNESDLTVANMSDMERYRALNEQVFRLRNGVPLHLDIQGRDHLQTIHEDVMLEAAATSFQVHFQMNQQQAVNCYNASLLTCAPLVAACANSPYLFGYDLWDETRIPLFEQSVRVRGIEGESRRPERVWFGSGFVRESLFELFEENLRRFPPLLPELQDDSGQHSVLDGFFHLRLHNGTLWRWVRPLVGSSNDRLHLRLEQRVMPAGPTVADNIANAAFYYGMLVALYDDPVLQANPFEIVKADFYRAARYGLDADMHWRGGRKVNVGELILQQLLPSAHAGLTRLGLDQADARHYLDIIRQRVASGQTGAAWQRAWMEKYHGSGAELVLGYHEQQESDKPVHEWPV